MANARIVKRSSSKAAARNRRHFRLRKRVSGTTARPRMVVNRSSRHVFVQIVDDTESKTLVSASTMEADLRSFDGDKTAKAKKVGELLAARAKDAGIEAVVFDRGGNRYAGRVAAIADGAREGGLTL
ncbi:MULTISPECIES: 50S ribosomal protein L18 [unclassified Yimella]|uniref:50S ribosomal protein L18 n=1 Tax=unclassified Yimella TaxID=2649892 RepID=UPI00101BC160|nr:MULTISPECIES: 50S ribosomal protein L18 [unclassified Yimella]MCG8656114.1 50S ribosomal protein L18 [Yimella sp. NH-Cas1]RYG76600.1 50S ribosomal protein L18 [Yimella sp. RIT 621]